MAGTKQVRIGGHFVPPLTDDILADYRRKINALPESSPYKDSLDKCWKCCKAWWELPEPNGTETMPHLSGTGIIVKMQDDHKDALWDLIPWDHELDALCGAPDGKLGLFDSIEADVSQRNGEKSQAWLLAVVNHLISTSYPADPKEYERVWAAIQTEDKWLASVSDAEKAAHAQRKLKAQKCCKAIEDAVNAKNYPPVPRPVFESTPLRHMATHLIWHVRELNLDREPLTSNLL